METQNPPGIWARAFAPETALHWLVALLLLCQGFTITVYIMGFSMMTDPRLPRLEFWGKVLEKAFGDGRVPWMAIGLLSIAYASAIILGLFFFKGRPKRRWLYIGWAILASTPVLILLQ